MARWNGATPPQRRSITTSRRPVKRRLHRVKCTHRYSLLTATYCRLMQLPPPVCGTPLSNYCRVLLTQAQRAEVGACRNCLSVCVVLLIPFLPPFFSSSTDNQPGPSFTNLFLLVQYSQSDLPPLRPLGGEAPGRDSNPGWADLQAGTLATRPPHLPPSS